MEPSTTESSGLPRLWGVYHANGGLLGELTYVMGKLRGTAHCALCDVTHRIRMKDEWKALAASLDMPLELVHLNEQPASLAEVTEGSTPCVVAETEDGFRILLGPRQLDSVGGSVRLFGEVLREAREARP
ncbi:MAG: hypothetical protein OEO79_18620 [Gemmatimonadota bacterium]|nr:hypothetical protein [Gemmatimonadota bacterium]